MSNQRLLGKYPIFGSEGTMGSKQTVSGYVYQEPNGFYQANIANYLRGFTKEHPVTNESMNGALGFVTNSISYLFERGIPEFTLNFKYSKGAVVTFNGGVYISLTDDNVKHVTQSSHWGKVQIEPNESKHNGIGPKQCKDSNPIGTILTVPNSTELEGYIDYVEGETFNVHLYPELFKALGSKTFGISNNGDFNNSLPIGSVVHLLSSNANVPDGWLEWTTRYGVLNEYPELYEELKRMVERLPPGSSKPQWQQALSTKSLPNFGSMYLGFGSNVGEYLENSTKQVTVNSLPVVVDNSNSLNPLGVSRCAVHEQINVPAVVGVTNTVANQSSKYVLVAHRAEDHGNVSVPYNTATLTENINPADVTRPDTLVTRLIIKATRSRPSGISSTHKQIIKAFN